MSIGGVVPLLLKRLGLDPAVASGPVLTTVTDMCGFECEITGREVVLWTSILVTVILFLVQFVNDALDFTLDLTAALSLAPYALASAYAVKIAVRRDGYAEVAPGRRTRELVIAVISTAYTLFLVWAAGYVFLFLACILLAPATALYVVARRQQQARVFTPAGLVVFIAIVVFAVIGVVLLATGIVQL